MADRDSHASIADASKPNAGRIYDFLLGGTHNFEVDRIAAEQFLKLAPPLRQAALVIRWFLGEAVRRLAEQGYRYFIDFASGLPTVDHIHQVAGAGNKVIYSDIDPVTVAYGQEILKDNPDARYLVCSAGKPEDLLHSPVVSELFGKTRKVAIGFNGIAYFVSDDSVQHAMHALYDWAAKGSRLFMCDFDSNKMTGAMEATVSMYKSVGQAVYFRDLARLKELIKPWKVAEPGFRPLEEWLEMRKQVAEQTVDAFGGLLTGVILEK